MTTLHKGDNDAIIIIICRPYGGYLQFYTRNSVAAVRYLQSVLHVMLLSMLNVLSLYVSTSRSMCAVPKVDVFCTF